MAASFKVLMIQTAVEQIVKIYCEAASVVMTTEVTTPQQLDEFEALLEEAFRKEFKGKPRALRLLADVLTRAIQRLS